MKSAFLQQFFHPWDRRGYIDDIVLEVMAIFKLDCGFAM